MSDHNDSHTTPSETRLLRPEELEPSRSAETCPGMLAADVRREIARLVLATGDRVRFYTHDGKNTFEPGWVTLDEAIASGRPFAGRLQAGMLVVDEDVHDEQGFQQIKNYLTQQGVPTVTVASGGSNRRHLFARVRSRSVWEQSVVMMRRRSAVLRAQPKAIAADTDVATALVVRGEQEFIRPPGTPHRSGGWSRLLDPADPDVAIARLRTPRPHAMVNAKNQTFLTNGAPRGQRSEAVQGLVNHLRYIGFDFEMIWDLLLAHPQGGGERLVEIRDTKGYGAARAWLRRSWEKAEKWRVPQFRSRTDAIDFIDAWRTTVFQRPAVGRTAGTRRRLLMFIGAFAAHIGRTTVSRSVRQLARDVGVAPATVIHALRAELADGWLISRDPETKASSAAYTLTIPAELLDAATPVPTLSPSVGVTGVQVPSSTHVELVTLQRHDIWRSAGLRGQAFLLYAFLSKEPVSTTELAVRARMPVSTVNRHLRALRDVGLADKSGVMHYLGTATLDEAAIEAGVAGAGDRVDQRFDRERVAYFGVSPRPGYQVIEPGVLRDRVTGKTTFIVLR